MRKKHTFLLTIIPSEEQRSKLRGRLQFISTGSAHTFTSIEELQELIQREIQSEENPGFPRSIQEQKSPYYPVDPQHWDEKY
jgi:UDP-galactopyranose mutase